MKEVSFSIHNDPKGQELWRSISGNFQRFPEIINEFMDDALSNFRATKPDQRRVEVRLRPRDGLVEVAVVDTGRGIRDIHAALTLGSRSGGETALNEHGMGLKHALASACAGGSWSIQTRTPEDDAQDRHLVVEGPYRLGDDPMIGRYLPGRGMLLGPTGTAVCFTCTKDLFATLRPAGDRTEKPFDVLVDILLEELGYTYAPILEAGEMELAVVVADHVSPVKPVFPTWDLNCFNEIPPTVLDLGGGPVTVSCCWGLIRADKDNHIYYRGNMESSGVEIRCNGRVMERGLDKRIWSKQPHNNRNHFLAVVELTAAQPGALPHQAHQDRLPGWGPPAGEALCLAAGQCGPRRPPRECRETADPGPGGAEAGGARCDPGGFGGEDLLLPPPGGEDGSVRQPPGPDGGVRVQEGAQQGPGPVPAADVLGRLCHGRPSGEPGHPDGPEPPPGGAEPGERPEQRLPGPHRSALSPVPAHLGGGRHRP